MSNPYGVPGISVRELEEKRARGDEFVLLDVREPQEWRYASMSGDVTKVPLSELARRRLEALPDNLREDKEAEVVVMCHHGVRSAQVTAWLRENGWQNVLNLDGGIDAYAREIDPSVGLY